MRIAKLLYVEDDPTDVQILKHAAGQSAHEYYIETCTRAEFANVLVRKIPFDAIFCDLRFRDGQDGAGFLKGHVRGALPTPLVAITGMPEASIDPELYALIQLGRILFLPKKLLDADTLDRVMNIAYSRKLRILYLGEDPGFDLMARDYLKRAEPLQFDLVHVNDPHAAREALESSREQWDVVLIDWTLSSGLEKTTEGFIDHCRGTDAVNKRLVITSNKPAQEFPGPVRALIERRAIGYCRKQTLSAADLVSAILMQRINRRVPIL